MFPYPHLMLFISSSSVLKLVVEYLLEGEVKPIDTEGMLEGVALLAELAGPWWYGIPVANLDGCGKLS